MAVFYRMVTIASINAYVLFLSYSGSPMITRFKFTIALGEHLIKPHLERRLRILNLRCDVKDTILKILGNNEAAVRPQVLDDKIEKRKTCASCPSVKERKTAYKCTRCSKPVCRECSQKEFCKMNQGRGANCENRIMSSCLPLLYANKEPKILETMSLFRKMKVGLTVRISCDKPEIIITQADKFKMSIGAKNPGCPACGKSRNCI
ncbi:hypothetical protein J6590_014031 [Homalodisca vitripennis]|nr:hypothetical protein J6590_014031 [Homalodisca vitripennis]